MVAILNQKWPKMKWRNRIPERGATITGSADNKKKKKIGYCNAERYKCPPNEQYKY
jgi:hypothetical protein